MHPTFVPSARAVNLLLLAGLLSLGYALYLRYQVIEQSTVGLACEAGLQTWLCWMRGIVIAVFGKTGFGIVALGAAALHTIRPNLALMTIAVAAAGFGIVLYNVETSALAVVLLSLSFARPQIATD